MAFDLIASFIGGALVVIAGIAILNALTFRRLSSAFPDQMPLGTVC